MHAILTLEQKKNLHVKTTLLTALKYKFLYYKRHTHLPTKISFVVKVKFIFGKKLSDVCAMF